MDEMQLLGTAVSVIITLGGFVAVIMKFVQPINELRVAIQKLIDNIDALKKDDETRDKRITKHGEEIDEIKEAYTGLDSRVGKLETKVGFYHKE